MERNNRIFNYYDKPKQNDKNHFETGIYAFNKIILSWSLEKIARFSPLPALLPKYTFSDALARSLITFISPHAYGIICNNYYESFKSHILEEARAVIATGLEASRNNKLKKFSFKVQNIKISKGRLNPTSVKAVGKLPKETEGRSCLAMSIMIDNKNFFAIGAEEGIDTGILNIKFIADQAIQEHHKFKKNQIWQAYVLGSLVSHQRMYEVCTLKPEINFLKNLVFGNLPIWSESVIDSFPNIKEQSAIESDTTQQVALNNITYQIFKHANNAITQSNIVKELPIHEAFKTFNNIQQSVAHKFIDAQNDLYLLQGPPGTGKTTTIVGILKSLADQNKRSMLCAPSNKAVQVIATRFLEKYSDVKMVLAGVESKLTENLREIFIQGWNIFIAKQILAYKDKLLNQLNIKQLLNLNLVNQPEDLKVDVLNKLAKISEISIKRVTNLIELRAPNFYRKICANLDALVKEIKQYKETFKLMLENIDLNELKLIKSYYTDNNKKSEEKSLNTIYKPALIESFETALNSINYYLEEIIDALSKADLELEMLNNAKVIFCTLSVAGRHMMRDINNIDVLIVDEAGQAVEAETLIPFVHKPKKCLLVGDVNQLPATVISPEAEKNHFGWSMMWRLLMECQQPYEILKIQYRMHAQIRQWPSAQYYQNMLQDGETIANRQLPYQVQENFLFTPYSFVNVLGKEEQNGTSFINRQEAVAIIDTLKYLKHQTNMQVHQHIGIISFYAGQVELLKRLVKQANLGNVRIHTVDGFQGDENDIILISFVRANNHANVGFLKDFRRLNVAITRPKHSLIMFGHLATLEKAHNSDVAKLVADIKHRNVLYTEQQLSAITQLPESITNSVAKQPPQNNNHASAAQPPINVQPSIKKNASKKNVPKSIFSEKATSKNTNSSQTHFYKPKQQNQNSTQSKEPLANTNLQLPKAVSVSSVIQTSPNNNHSAAKQPPAPVQTSVKKAKAAAPKKANVKNTNSSQSRFYKPKQQPSSLQYEAAAVNTNTKLADSVPQVSVTPTLPNNNFLPAKQPPAPTQPKVQKLAPKNNTPKKANVKYSRSAKTNLYRPKLEQQTNLHHEETSASINNTNTFVP